MGVPVSDTESPRSFPSTYGRGRLACGDVTLHGKDMGGDYFFYGDERDVTSKKLNVFPTRGDRWTNSVVQMP